MSRGSPRHSFSPVRPMNQPVNSDRRRASSYIPNPYDRPFTSREANHTEPQSFRSPWEEKDKGVPARQRSPINIHGGRPSSLYNSSYEDDRSYRPVTPFQDRPPISGPSAPFQRALTPIPPFSERVTSSTFAPDARPGGDHWSPGASQPTGTLSTWDERLPGNDHWSPPATQPSSSWESRGQRPDIQGWSSRPNVSAPYNNARPPPDTSQRPLLEPSQAWRRARDERDRKQLSLEYRTFIPADHRSLPSDSLAGDGGRAGPPSVVPATTTQNSNDSPDFQARRFRQQSQPSQLPHRFDQRSRYPERFQGPVVQRHTFPTDLPRPRGPGSFSASRRPQHRISARISARPNRSPTPSSSDSSSASSRVRKPGHRSSRSRSRSGRSRSRLSSLERESYRDSGRRPPSPRRNSQERRPRASSPRLLIPLARQLKAPRSHVSLVRPNPVAHLRFLPPKSVRSPPANIPSRRSRSVSSRSSESSIRSSVHSSPALVTTEVPPTSHAHTPVPQSAPAQQQRVPDSQSSPPTLPPQEDNEELPGMRFQKDGALKPGFSPPSLKSALDIQSGLKGAEQAQPDVHNSSGRPVYSPVEVDNNEDDRFPTQSPERVVGQTAEDAASSVDKLKSPLLPSHSITADGAATEVVPLPRSSPTLQSRILPQASVHKPSGSSPVLPKQKVPSTLQPIQRLDVTADSGRPDPSRLDTPKQVDMSSIAPDSSPLSEPMPLSPPPNILELNEDMEDASSSMDIDDESSSEPADDIPAALRVFVKAREGKDLQTRHERFEPILRTNQSLLDLPYNRISTSNEKVVQEVMEGPFRARLEAHSTISQSLLDRFTKHAEDLTDRTRRLRAEYKSYHDRWVANCRKLDQSMASSASQGIEGLPLPSGRVTRRSTTFGDAVRSDLEMEQIIASLGNEDMTDPNVLAIRNTAVIPDLVSTDPFAVDYLFDDSNGLVDDPEEVYDVYDALGRWTDEEKDIYEQKYGVYPKQFGVIASFLPGKTPAQCAMFYYLHKKELIDFRGLIAKYGPKRKRGRKAGKGKGNALLADIMKPPRAGADDEGTTHKHSDRFRKDLAGVRFPTRRPVAALHENAGEPSRTLLNTTSTRGSRLATLQYEDVASDAESGHSGRQRPSPRVSVRGGRTSPSEDEGGSGIVVVTYADDRRKRQARSGDSKDLASEQDIAHEPAKKMKQAARVSIKRPPGRPPKHKNKDRVHVIDKDGASSSSTVQKTATSYVWSKGEEASYLRLVARHGKDFERIAADMPAKTAIQCRNYFRNHAKDLDLERIANDAVAPKNSVGSVPKDKGTSKTTKSKDVAGGEGDIGGAGTPRGNRSRQTISSTSSKGKDKQTAPSDPISAALNAIFTPSASTASNGSASTKDEALSKRLPNFVKSKRQEIRPKD